MVLEPPGKVRGRVVDADGNPGPGVVIQLNANRVGYMEWPEAAAKHTDAVVLRAQTETDANGAWEFDGLVPGLQYMVYVTDGPARRTRFYEQFMPIPGDTVDLGDLGGKQED